MPWLGVPVIPPAGLIHERVRLRILCPTDVVLLQELSQDPDVVRWTTYPGNLDKDQALARIDRSRQLADRALLCVMEWDGTAAGTCGVSVAVEEGTVEIFYAVLPTARRQGIASTAVAVLSTAAREAGARRINLETHPDNVASQAVARKAGFVLVGEKRRVVKELSTPVMVWEWGV